jgi:hypothetical protein
MRFRERMHVHRSFFGGERNHLRFDTNITLDSRVHGNTPLLLGMYMHIKLTLMLSINDRYPRRHIPYAWNVYAHKMNIDAEHKRSVKRFALDWCAASCVLRLVVHATRVNADDA